MKFLIIIILTIYAFINQDNGKDVVEQLEMYHNCNQKYVRKLKKKVYKSKCSHLKSDINGYKPFFIYHCVFKAEPKKEFYTETDTFFSKLSIVLDKKSNYPKNSMLLYNENNEIAVSISYDTFVYCYNQKESYDQKVLDFALKNNSPYAFLIEGGNVSLYYVLVNSEPKILDFRDGELKVFDIQDFMLYNWK